MNCGAIPESLIESELFGSKKEPLQERIQPEKESLNLAQNGTLFLDEIGTMPLQYQVRLLRVLEERKITRVGGEQKFQSVSVLLQPLEII